MAGGERGAATYDAAPNIALIKYWGMRDPGLGLPTNSSVSVTLDRLRSRTSVRFDARLPEDSFSLNGVEPGGAPLLAVTRFLDRVRRMAGTDASAEVISSNNFQTASGLASSASGFAALAGAASVAAGLHLSPRALSQLARFGSGSASRSVFGGFVEWRAGRRPDGRDCYAMPLFGPTHWPQLVDVVALVAGAPEKAVRSADAMQSSVANSPLYRDRQLGLPERIRRVRAALRTRNAARLFGLIMEECDEFRAVCESTDPPLDYLTGASRAILEAVRQLNREVGRPVAGYTHDAGAHVHIFTLERDASRLRRRLEDVSGISRVLTLHPGPGARLVRGPSR
ncbi:MAG TPA: diphosphomevalonate decarboxylase [Thermoplasmata archaeon]|nr:diphosphomevalonate decarboxylase [Thermoplasmata archaeon]